jgi:diguanylate cyclase (GGDEF)-like protein/PAS domain S-box-containing protein
MATILVVDDRNLNREFLTMLFGYAGHRVVEARNGAEALDRVRESRPDVIISDIVMPRMDGVEFVKRLRADAAMAQIPVIFYTATYRLTEARNIAQACGVDTVIAKPSRPQVILDAVAAALGSTAAPELDLATRETWKRPPKVLAETLSDELDSLSLRLAALLELALELAAERDPQRLLDLACRAAVAIFGARLTAIGMLDGAGQRPGRFVACGVTDAVRPRFGELDLSAVVSDGKPHRLNDPAAAAAVLPGWHPPISSLLVVPLKSATRTLGWLYVADRDTGSAPFGEDDEQIAATLATQLAQAYENLVLYSETSAYATQLEAEVAERKRAQHALRESEAHFRAVFDHAPIGMAVVSQAGQFLRVNLVLCKLVGYAKDQLEKLSFHEIIDADDRAEVMADLRALANDERLDELEKRYLCRDGSTGWMLLTASGLRNGEGDALHFIVQIKDISERKKAEEELKLAASVFDNTRDGVMVIDTMARIISVNPAFTAITGFSAEEAVGRKPNLMHSEQAPSDFCCELWDVLLREGHWEGEVWNRRKSGDAFLEWLSISMVPGPDGKPVSYVGVFNDITELRRKDEHIRHLAFHDPLTGVPNRSLLLDRLEHSIAFAEREQQHVGLMFIDLDRFKAVNDSLGHDVGDALLQEVAHRLSQCVRQSDTVARIGGDEFVILLEHARHPADYASLARKAVDSLGQPVKIGKHTIRVGASIGIACFPGDGADVFEMMKSADAAMYAAKSAGRGTYRFFQPAMSEGAAQRRNLEMELRNAVANGEMELYYQPMVSLGSDEPFGVEAQLRWRHPERGLVMPADFIPLAEETGIITELGDWVLGEACRQSSAWQALGLGRNRIAVTVAAKQLQQGNLAARIASLARRHGILPSDLEIKLTESVILANRGHIETIIDQLREIGVSVAIDDFGTSASSLAYLRGLPIDSLSIDRSLVSQADHDEDDAQFVRSILALGQALNATVVAEGVETESQADFLRACGCTLGQGYLYARPAPAAQTEVWLRGHAGGGRTAPAPVHH